APLPRPSAVPIAPVDAVPSGLAVHKRSPTLRAPTTIYDHRPWQNRPEWRAPRGAVRPPPEWHPRRTAHHWHGRPRRYAVNPESGRWRTEPPQQRPGAAVAQWQPARPLPGHARAAVLPPPVHPYCAGIPTQCGWTETLDR